MFERFGQLLSRLAKKERDLVLTLLEDFLHCTYVDLMPLLTTALKAIPAAAMEGVGCVIFLPLAETTKNGTPKSPSALLYPVAHHVVPYMASFSGKTVSVYEKMELLSKDAHSRPASLIILLDDFIGSGGSAVKAIKKYRPLYARPLDLMLVAVAASQQQGIDLIAQEGVTVYAATVRGKGISDSKVIADRAAALAIMDSLEKRLGVEPEYLRGFGQCEALVKMMRTPNNTFPIFWQPTTRSGEGWPAPFRRFA